ncbi:GroES-like protein [Schizophyllum commune Loenen D]|nr:GroES-like protein [Schizophyllum commune Loenen D]
MGAPETMVAYLYKPGFDDLIRVDDYPVQQPRKGEVLCKVLACGVCHTDVAILNGYTNDSRSYVLGHEICATAIALGEGVDPNIKLGHRYAIQIANGCTRALKPHTSAALNAIGTGGPGGYADYITVADNLLVPVPDDVPDKLAAIAADAGTTAYNVVVNTGQVKASDKVLIIGVGGLGHLAVQYARLQGAEVYVCDLKPEARRLGLELGAVKAFSPVELSNAVAAADPFTVHVVVDFAVSAQTFSLGLGALVGEGDHYPTDPRYVLVGISGDNLVFTSGEALFSAIQIRANLYGTRSATEAALELFANGSVKARVVTEPFENVNKIIDELRAYEVSGRKVLQISELGY